jgi:acetaldehyde dehydrogenase (acetylating)
MTRIPGARRMGVATTHEGVGGLMQMAEFADIDFVFDATSARLRVDADHHRHFKMLAVAQNFNH